MNSLQRVSIPRASKKRAETSPSIGLVFLCRYCVHRFTTVQNFRFCEGLVEITYRDSQAEEECPLYLLDLDAAVDE